MSDEEREMKVRAVQLAEELGFKLYYKDGRRIYPEMILDGDTPANQRRGILREAAQDMERRRRRLAEAGAPGKPIKFYSDDELHAEMIRRIREPLERYS